MSVLHQKTAWTLPVSLLIVLVAGMLLLAGCESTKTPTDGDGDGNQSVILSTPTATPESIATGGTSIIEVSATDSLGAPISGLTVSFVGSGGYFTPASAATDSNGIASTIFTATSSGTLQVGASATGATTRYVAVTVSSSGEQQNGNVDMTITPVLLSSEDGSTATISVQVQDLNENPAPDSTVVLFAAGEKFADLDNNGYFTPGVDSVIFDNNENGLWDAIGQIPDRAYTNGGVATVIFTPGSEATTAWVRATVSGTDDFDGFDQTAVTITPNTEIYSIYLFVDEPEMQVKHTGGIEHTKLHAVGYDKYGNHVPAGVEINFLIVDAPDIPGIADSCNINNLGRGPVTVTTNSNGMATVTLWSGIKSGTIRAYASATGESGPVLSQATLVAVHAGPPYYISVGAEECNIQGWSFVNQTNSIVAIVSDTFHNPVQSNVAVYFTVDESTIEATSVTTDQTGVATTTFRSSAPWVDGDVWVTAETSGGTVTAQTMFYNSYYPATVDISIGRQSFLATGKDKEFFFVDVRDLNDNFVVNGTQVKTLTTYGSATQGGTINGCQASIFEGEYTALTLDQDFSMNGSADDTIGAIDYLVCRSGFVSSSVACTLHTGGTFATNSSVKVDAASIPYDATGVPAMAIVKDRYDNPLGDHVLTATISPGTLSNATQKTNTFGEASGFLINAPSAPPPDVEGNIPDTKAVLTITDTDPNGNGVVLSINVTFAAPE